MLQTILVADKRFKPFCILLGITAKYYTISAAVKSKAGVEVEEWEKSRRLESKEEEL
jgi:hypothetical protein